MARSVVVIDNDEQVRRLVCAALEQDDFAAVGVASYPAAIEQLCWSPADLVISDGFTADGISGVSHLHRLFPRLRHVVLSGVMSQQLQVPFSGTRCIMVLPKPCDLEALHHAVHQALTHDTDACLQEILERGRLGFCMVMLRE